MKKTETEAKEFWRETPLVGEGEIFDGLAAGRGSSLFLGRYALGEILSVLAKRSLLKEARKKYLWPLEFELDSSEFPRQRLRVFLKEKKAENVIVDLKVREMDFVPKNVSGFPASIPPLKVLAFEWLTLQNPLLEFSERRPRLPGQTLPGLRMSKKIMDLFVFLGRLTRKDALLAYPAYFHNALLFSRYFRFWDPRRQGEVLAIRRIFSHMPLHKLAWVVHLNCLRRNDGTVYEWAAAEQLYPLTRALKDTLDSRSYREIVKTWLKKTEFSVDWAEFEKKTGVAP